MKSTRRMNVHRRGGMNVHRRKDGMGSMGWDECAHEDVDDEGEMDGWMDGHRRSRMKEGESTMSHSPLTPQNVSTDSPTWAHCS